MPHPICPGRPIWPNWIPDLMPDRISNLTEWVRRELELTDDCPLTITSVAGDASFRRYFRASSPGKASYIVMDAPPEKEDCIPFVCITESWLDQGIQVPRLYGKNLEEGFLLLEDFGDQQMLDHAQTLDLSAQKSLYTTALNDLIAIQRLPENALSLPRYDEGLLSRELDLFSDWLISEALTLDLSDLETAMIERTRKLLVDNALSQPQVVVHRDYHSRNLMLRDDGSIGIIDFQDAVFGPVTYDLVSLLRDCYIKLDPSLVYELARAFQAHDRSMAADMSETDFLRAFDLMGIQRHMKAAGIFVRLALRDGKFGYLQDIPRTLSYISEVCSSYSELQEFGRFVHDKILPDIEAFIQQKTDAPST